MAAPPGRLWEPVPDSPRRRLDRAGFRDLVLMLPLAVLAVVAGVLVGRVVALPLLAAAVLVRPTLMVTTGSTPGFRRQHIRLVRTGGGPPGRWRPFVWHLAPFVLLPAPVVLFSGSSLWPLGFVPWLAVLAIGWWRGRGPGAKVDPVLALAGLDVVEDGAAPTPSGTSGPPGAGSPPPTPAGPATPDPALRPARPGPR